MRITVEATSRPPAPEPASPAKNESFERKDSIPVPNLRPLISAVSAAPPSRQSRLWVRNLLACILAIGLLGAILWFWHHAKLRQQAVVLNNEGFVLLQGGRMQEACEKLELALDLVPSFVESIVNLARCTELSGDASQALALYRKAVELRPADALYHYNLGSFLTSREQYDDAMPELRKAIELRSSYVEAYNELGNVYYALGYFTEATDLLSQALSFEEQIDSATAAVLHKNLARSLLRDGKTADAVSHLDVAQRNSDLGSARYQDVLYLLASAYDQMGDSERACGYLGQLANFLVGDVNTGLAADARPLAEHNGCPLDARPNGTSPP